MFERIPASDREAWLKLRGQDITASIAGALLGVHEYTSAFEIWALKTGRVKDDPEETPAMRRGTLLEPVAVEILREEHPDWKITHNAGPDRVYLRDPEARIGATPDLTIVNEFGRGNVNIKSVEQSVYRRKWMTPEREVEPPLWVAVQCLLEGHLDNCDWVGVAPMVIGFGIDLSIVQIPKKPKIIDMVYEKTREFWRIVEAGEEMQPEFGRDGEVIARMYEADDGSEADLSGNKRALEIVAAATEAKKGIKEIEKVKDTLDAEMKAILGNHSTGRLADGRLVKWRVEPRAGHVVRPSTPRVLRYPKE